jgi:hypothetical protein
MARSNILRDSIVHRCDCSANGTIYGCARQLDRLTELIDAGLCIGTDDHVADGEGTHDCPVCGLYEVK